MRARIPFLLALFLSMFVGVHAHAQGKIEFEGISLSWQEGNLGERDFDGNVRNLRLRVGGEVVARADRLIVNSRKEGNEMVVDRIRLFNLDVPLPNASSVAVRRIDMNGARFEGDTIYDPLIRSHDGNVDLNLEYDFIDSPFRNFNIDGLEVDLDGLLRLEIDGVEFKDGAGPAAQVVDQITEWGEFTVNGLRLWPVGEGINLAGIDLKEFMDANGRDVLAMDFGLAVNGVETAEGVDTRISFNLDAVRFGYFGFDIDLVVLAQTVKLLNSLDIGTESEQEAALNILLGGTEFRRAEILLQSNGLLSAIGEYNRQKHDVSPTEQVNQFMDGLDGTVGRRVQQTWASVSGPVRRFLGTGGILYASMHPAEPVSIHYLLESFRTSPDAAFTYIGLDVGHQR